MQEGLPGLPQLVQEAGQLKMQLTKVLVNELGSGSATDEQRPALLLEEFYGQQDSRGVHGPGRRAP